MSTYLSFTSASEPVVVLISTDRPQYDIDEVASITVKVTNKGGSPVTFHFRSTRWFDFAVYNSLAREVYRNSRHEYYLMVLTNLTLNPGESKEYVRNWNLVSDEGTKLDPGRYYIIGEFGESDERVFSERTSIDLSRKDSSSIAFTVSNLTLDVSKGETAHISVALTPPLQGKTVIVEYSTDNLNWSVLSSGETSASGEYTFEWRPPDLGTYYIRSYWEGDDHYKQATSQVLTITAVPEFPDQAILPIMASLIMLITIHLRRRLPHNQDSHNSVSESLSTDQDAR